jgi:hypothetical protein
VYSLGRAAARYAGGVSVRFLILLIACVLALANVSSGAAQTLPGSEWQPAAGASGDNTFEGFIDQPSAGTNIASGASFQVSGWIVDTTAEGWSGIDDVQVMLGSTSLAHLAAGQSRPDVASALGNPFFGSAGFAGTVSTALPGGTQTLTVVAHTPGKGSWSKSVTVNVGGSSGATPAAASATGLVLRVISPAPDDVVTSNNNGTIFGLAYDTRTSAQQGSGVDRVQLYLDGPRGTAGSQNLGDASLSGTNWSLSWQPTKFNGVRHHILWVYAHSAVTGEEVLVQQDINLSS